MADVKRMSNKRVLVLRGRLGDVLEGWVDRETCGCASTQQGRTHDALRRTWERCYVAIGGRPNTSAANLSLASSAMPGTTCW